MREKMVAEHSETRSLFVNRTRDTNSPSLRYDTGSIWPAAGPRARDTADIQIPDRVAGPGA